MSIRSSHVFLASASLASLLFAAGCDLTPFVDQLSGHQAAAPAVVEDAPDSSRAKGPLDVATEPLRSAARAAGDAIVGVVNTATMSPDEIAVRALFSEDRFGMETDGQKQLDRLTPADRSQLIVRMAGIGYLFLGPNSEAGQMVTAAGLLDAKYQPLSKDLEDGKIDSPQNQELADEAASKISDPARLVSLVSAELKARLPDARFELINLSIDGDEASGVVLMVTYLGTSPGPFAARRIDGRWLRQQTSAAAERKVQEYKDNPVEATVKLPPRPQIRLTAAELSREFQTNPSGAAQKYGGVLGNMWPGAAFGPFGPAEPAGQPQGLIIPTAPKTPDHELIVEGTVLFVTTDAKTHTLYLVTPAGAPRMNLTVDRALPLAKTVAAAKCGQTLVATVDAAFFMDSGEDAGLVALSSQKLEVSGQPAEPYGPLTAYQFLDEIRDPALAAQNQARPIVIEGFAESLARGQTPFVTIVDNAGNRVPCLLQESQVRQLRTLRPRQTVRLQGYYVPPVGRNQLLLHNCVIVP